MKPRTVRVALRAALAAWSPRAYEFRLVFSALLAGVLARWVHLSPLWAVISAILVLEPDPAATQRNTLVRFVATLIGGAASVGVVSLGIGGIPALALALLLTCTLCATLDLEDGLRPGCVCTAVLLIRPEGMMDRAEELHFALERILAVLGGGVVSLAVAYIPGWRATSPDKPPSLGG